MSICVPTIATTLITEYYVTDKRRMFYIMIKIK